MRRWLGTDDLNTGVFPRGKFGMFVKSNGGVETPTPESPGVVEPMPVPCVELKGYCVGIPASWRKWSSSKVDMGCVGYAKGSSDGNIIGMRSGKLAGLVNCCAHARLDGS